jgi:hypothetical protein
MTHEVEVSFSDNLLDGHRVEATCSCGMHWDLVTPFEAPLAWGELETAIAAHREANR